MSETWAAVPGWEGLYEVSGEGSVRSLRRYVVGRPGVMMPVGGRPLRPNQTESGHLVVALSRNNKRTTIGVHRLVLLAFVGPCPPKQEACHNNGTPTDNRLANLRWGTRSDNAHDKVRHGTHPHASKTHCSSGHPFDASNTYISPSGGRHCRTCRLAAKRAYSERRKVA